MHRDRHVGRCWPHVDVDIPGMMGEAIGPST